MCDFLCGQKINLLLFLLSYLLGSIPFGLLFTRIGGHGDIRKHGSGNIGATNVLRTSGKFIAFLTLIFDGGKGALAIFIASRFCDDYLLLMVIGVIATLGHIFPVWLKFKGGKGVATSFAVFLMLSPAVGIVACSIWLITLFAIRISGVAALVSFSITPIFCYFMTYDIRLVVTFSIMSVLVIWRHKSNIKQLMSA